MSNDPEFDEGLTQAIARMEERGRLLYGEDFAKPASVTSEVTFHQSGFGLLSSAAIIRLIDFANVQHRAWLVAPDLIRGEITVMAAPGGLGKSSYAIALSVAAASGKSFLQKKIYGGKLRVIYINAEDSRDEVLRRVWAVGLLHSVTASDLSGLQLLGTDDWQVQGLTFLSNERFGQAVNQAGLDIFETILQAHRPDLVVLDPLIALCGTGNMNDNAAMGSVMKSIKKIAGKFKAAMLILHHTRKGADISTSDSIGGASAIVNLSRRALQLASMTAEEAIQNKVLPSERQSYFRIVPSKSNLVPASADTEWCRLRNVILPNASPPTYPNGDNVQAVERVILPLLSSHYDAIEQNVLAAILKVVDQGKIIDGLRHPYSPSLSGADNKRSLLDDATDASLQLTQGSLTANDVSAIVRRCVKSMLADGRLVVETIPDGRFRRGSGIRTKSGSLPQGVEAKPINSALKSDAVPE